MSTIEKSFIPILDKLFATRVETCMVEFDDELFACQFGINACISTLATSHYLHTDDDLGRACKLHSLKSAHDFLAAFQLLRSSMHSQAANAARLGCETAWQNAWLHEVPTRATEWYRGERIQPDRIRKQIPRLQPQRQCLYRELSQMAHPNTHAMVALSPPAANTKTIDLDVLLPLYDPQQIRAMLFRLFYCLYVALIDFDEYHIQSLSDTQKAAWTKQSESMRLYYDQVAKYHLPNELQL